jgi:Ca2+-binding RTX toxin-like protein
VATFDGRTSPIAIDLLGVDPLISGDATITVADGSTIRGVFPTGAYIELRGVFWWSNGFLDLSHGSLTGMAEGYNGAVIYDVSGFNLSMPAIADYINRRDFAGIDLAIFHSDDTVYGTRFDDVLLGYAGNDTIDGGVGIDTAVYSGFRSQYTVGFAAGALTVSGPDGIDYLSNIEWLRFADDAFNPPPPSRPAITIHSGADIHSATDGATLFREVASDNALKESMELAHLRLGIASGATSGTGTSGRDLIYFTPSNPALAHVAGGGGDDVYVVQYLSGPLRDGDPRITEVASGGEDTVWVSENDYVLPNYVENLVSMTERGLRMLANDFANKFIGGPGDDQLFSGTNDDIVYGREGNDLIVGGTGNDTLFGAAGADTFAWERDHIGENDRIMDWEAGQDRIDLRAIAQGSEYFRVADSAGGVQISLVDASAVLHPIVAVVDVHDEAAVRWMMGVDADDFVALASGSGSYGSGVVVTMVDPVPFNIVAASDVGLGSAGDQLAVMTALDTQIAPALAFTG